MDVKKLNEALNGLKTSLNEDVHGLQGDDEKFVKKNMKSKNVFFSGTGGNAVNVEIDINKLAKHLVNEASLKYTKIATVSQEKGEIWIDLSMEDGISKEEALKDIKKIEDNLKKIGL